MFSEKTDCIKILNLDPSDVKDRINKINRKLYWIGTESVGRKLQVLKGHNGRYQTKALGGITLTISDDGTRFFEYWKKLRPTENKRNVWFDQFWEQHYGCKLENLGCKEKSTEEANKFFSKIKPTMQAVNAYAMALKEMHNTMCAGLSGICPEMRSKKGSHFFKNYLIKTKTNSMQNDREDTRIFNDTGELHKQVAGYDVNQFQHHE